jgi:ABC-type Fe3+ transport system permease subunit
VILFSTSGVASLTWLWGLVFSTGDSAPFPLDAWFTTIGLAAASSTAAWLLAAPVAWLIGNGGRILASLALVLCASVLLIPPYVYAYTWNLIAARETAIGRWIHELTGDWDWSTVGWIRAWIVLTLWVWPVAAIWVGRVWAASGSRLLEQGVLDCGRIQLWFRLLLPAYRRHILGATAVMAFLTLTEYTTPHLYGISVITTEMLASAQSSADASLATISRHSFPLAVVGILCAALLARTISQFGGRAPVPDEGRSPIRWSRPHVLLQILIAIIPVVAAGWPLAALIAGGDLTGSLDDSLRLVSEHALMTVQIGAGAAAVSLWIAISTSLVGGAKMRWCALLTLGLTAALPGAAVGGSLLIGYNYVESLVPAVTGGTTRPLSPSDTAWIVIATCVCRYGVIMVAAANLILADEPSEHREMGRLDGAGPWRIALEILAPAVWRPVLGVGIVVWALSISELAATALTLPPRVKWLPHLLINEIHQGRGGAPMGCAILITAVVGAVLAAFVIGERIHVGSSRRRGK